MGRDDDEGLSIFDEGEATASETEATKVMPAAAPARPAASRPAAPATPAGPTTTAAAPAAPVSSGPAGGFPVSRRGGYDKAAVDAHVRRLDENATRLGAELTGGPPAGSPPSRPT